MTDYTTQPLHQIERAALDNPEAEAELARRQIERLVNPAKHAESHILRVHTAWLQGFRAGQGERNPYRGRNNFHAPQRRAWTDGMRKRHELECALKGAAW